MSCVCLAMLTKLQIIFLLLSGCPRKEIYFMALIDILTHYGMKKRTAQAAKTMKHGAGAEISTVKPEQYARRFLEFIERILGWSAATEQGWGWAKPAEVFPTLRSAVNHWWPSKPTVLNVLFNQFRCEGSLWSCNFTNWKLVIWFYMVLDKAFSK